MTIELTIDPALEVQISSEARVRGISVVEYAREALIEKAQSRVRWAARERKMTTDEFIEAMAYRGCIPETMHNQKITREFIYGDHP